MNDLDELKNFFDRFLRDAQQQTIHRLDSKEWLKLNSQIFELQTHIYQGLKTSGVNLILNPILQSQSIISSFSKDFKALLPQDLCLPFLDFLNVHKEQKFELFELIDHFLEEHKEELTWQDIVITASGATRCKTNLRFALNQLRKIGLVKKLDGQGKRVFVPSEQGELVFYLWRRYLSPGTLEDDWTKHELLIHESGFYKLHLILMELLKSDFEKLRQEITTFQRLQVDVLMGPKLPVFLTNIQKFLDNALITETGIYLNSLKDEER